MLDKLALMTTTSSCFATFGLGKSVITVARAKLSASWFGTGFCAWSAHFEAWVVTCGVRTTFCAFFFAGRAFFMAFVLANMAANFCLVANFLARFVEEPAKAFTAISCTIVTTLKNFFTRSQAVIERNWSGAIATAFDLSCERFLGTCRAILVDKFSAWSTFFETLFCAIMTTRK